MKTIQNDTHIMWVDETAEIKENTNTFKEGFNGDWFWNSISNSIARIGDITSYDFKIIAAYPKLEGCLEFKPFPPTHDDVIMEKIIKSIPDFPYQKNTFVEEKILQFGLRCYKQAKSETMFSLENMKKCYEYAWNKGRNNQSTNISEYIQPLIKSKELEFVPQMEEVEEYHKFIGYKEDGSTKHPFIKKPKIVNNKVYGEWKKI